MKIPECFDENWDLLKPFIHFVYFFRKLRAIVEEYSTRVGQQAVVLCCTPGKPNQNYQSFKVFGSQPLETVVCLQFSTPSITFIPYFIRAHLNHMGLI